MMFRSVIFDMDGVIVDSEPLHIQSERLILKPFNLNLSDEEFHKYMGRTPRILLEGIIRDYDLPTTADDLLPVHMQQLAQLYQEKGTVIPGAIEAIRHLSEKGLILGLASSSDWSLINIILDKFKLRSFFKAVTSGEDVKRVKPEPDIFLKTAQNLGIEPDQCLVVEDSAAGVQSAKNAGMSCIGFRSPNSHNQDLSRADLAVDSLEGINYIFLSKLYQKLFSADA